jgi:rRNA maturation RNase YbeY
MAVRFFSEDTNYLLKDKRKIGSWLADVVKSEGHELVDLNIILVSDEHLHKMNVDFLDHDTLTDIITFENTVVASQIEGELYISIDRVKENATKLSVNLIDELHRVMVHGVLHLCGYGDKTPKKKAIMREKEDISLKKRKKHF